MSVRQPRSLVGAAPPAAATEAGSWFASEWVVRLFAAAAVLLLPWVVLLVVALPSTHRARHWDIAWVGFDVMLVLLLLTVAATAWRRSPWLEGAATATATLLFVDAWFDVLTSSTRTEFVVALIEAAFVELPLAILCLVLARAAKRRLEPLRSLRPAAPARLSLVGADSEVESSDSDVRRTA